MQALLDDVAQKVFSAYQGKVWREANYDRLFDAEDSKTFNFLIEGLQ